MSVFLFQNYSISDDYIEQKSDFFEQMKPQKTIQISPEQKENQMKY